jgi:hypothetical protein
MICEYNKEIILIFFLSLINKSTAAG